MQAAGTTIQGALNVHIAFRVDASSRIGSGHVARCRRLAARLRDAGHQTSFLVCDPSENLRRELLGEGSEVCILPIPSSEVSEAEDGAAAREVLAGRRPDWLVVDHYALDKNWETEMREAVGRLMVIDDLERSHDCDLLLDQGWLGEGDAYPDVSCQKLLGPRFALLPPAYAQLRSQAQRRNAPIKRVLVFFGGADGSGQTLRVLEAIDDGRFSHLHFDIVVGAQNSQEREIVHYAACLPNVSLKAPLETLAGLMSEADLFVGAGGATTWERCCLGLPAIVCWTAENQKAQTLAVAAMGAQVQLGSADEQTPKSWREAMLATLADPSRVQFGASSGMALVDGLGVERVACQMLGAYHALGADEPRSPV
jgi:UDP-2,4-diacetamido-2,4,6-trideoxy-beta-L-altropyranose hydrolase